SLHKHIRDGWSIFNPELGEYITLLPPQMRTGQDWYKGDADAIYQNLYILERSKADYFIIGYGDHIYRMDYEPLIEFHIANNADLTLTVMSHDIDTASEYGVVGLDENQQVSRFHEKPEKPWHLPGEPDKTLISTGVYVVSRDVLFDLVKKDQETKASTHHMGEDIIPRIIRSHRVFGYQFGGDKGRVSQDRYWRNITNLDAFFDANMDLLNAEPPINLYQPDWPIRTYSGQYPPARTVPGLLGNEGISINSIINSGSVISGGSVQESILFHNVVVEDEAQVQRSILFDDVVIKAGASVQNCIIEKRVVIPNNMNIGFDYDEDIKHFHVTPAGIVVISRSAMEKFQ
ncbi:MAG: sugar phosphate nucleotidyltransferase, partial [Gammaproteobacteria bacterium]|nr:sugar phosphate nucleotidyltransferase [Gammaproteobacteria bacterium]